MADYTSYALYISSKNWKECNCTNQNEWMKHLFCTCPTLRITRTQNLTLYRGRILCKPCITDITDLLYSIRWIKKKNLRSDWTVEWDVLTESFQSRLCVYTASAVERHPLPSSYQHYTNVTWHVSSMPAIYKLRVTEVSLISDWTWPGHTSEVREIILVWPVLCTSVYNLDLEMSNIILS